MSHQRPLNEEVDFYDDGQNLLDVVTDGPVDDELWYQAQLKAAIQESLTDTGSTETADGSQGRATAALQDEFLTQLQLEEVLWASQLEGITSQQQEERERVMVSVDSGLCADMDDGRDTSSDEEKSEELREVLEMQRAMTTMTMEEHLSRAGTRLRRQKLRRKACRDVDEEMAFLNEDSISPEQAEVLQGKSTSSASNLQSAKDREIESIARESCLVPSPFNDNGIPETWDCEASDTNFSTEDYTLVTLLPGNAEYDAISQEFSKAALTVVSIERLQNFMLLDRYRREKEHILENRQNGFDINEQYLYHGTKVAKRVVCEESLDQRLSRKGHFGRGIYFSDNPRKCLQYVSSSEEAICVLMCRVILGETKVYPRGQSDLSLKREPAKEAPSGGWKFYDSVKGCPRDFNEFVIYDSRRAMTEYIIMCKKSVDELDTNQSTATVSKEATAEQAVPTTDSNTRQIGTGTKLKWVPVPVTFVNGDDNSNAVTIATSPVTASPLTTTMTTTTTDSGAASEGVVSVTSGPRVQNDEQSHRDDRNISDEDSDAESVNSEMSDCPSVSGDRDTGDGNDLGAVADDVSDLAFPGPPSIVPFNLDQGGVVVRDDDHEERIRKVREEIQRQRQLEKSQQAANPSGKKVNFIVDTSALSRQSFRQLTEDPVELVLSGLIVEFKQVTQITDDSVARRHITQADMNLDQAILNYYNNLG